MMLTATSRAPKPRHYYVHCGLKGFTHHHLVPLAPRIPSRLLLHIAPSLLSLPARGCPPLGAHHEARVERGQQNARHRNHGPLEHHEGDLLVGQGPVKPAGQLGTPEHGPHKDEGSRQEHSSNKKRLEHPLGPQVRKRRVQLAVAAVPPARQGPHAQPEVEAQRAEQRQGKHLPRHARHHGVDAGLQRGGVGPHGGRDGAAGRLQQQRDEVEHDEDVRVHLRAEAGALRGVDDDEPGQGQVDGGREEGGGDGEADEVPVEREGVRARGR